MQEENYFSWENFSELADLNNHISYASKLLEAYDWSDEAFEKLSRRLQRIKDKQKDKLLNLSVIGEFSTGKSSFINSILRHDLLVSSVLQGTTVANTSIEYSEKYFVGLEMLDGVEIEHEFDNIENLHHCIEEYTTKPETARRLHLVHVGLPSENLRRGMRLIDTPGTNALEQWHEEVTKNAIMEWSDLSVILVDATKPLPDSFCNFIESNLSGILHRCVFVVTKFDLLEPRERDGMLIYIRNKVQKMTDRDDCLVLPFVSTEVINSFKPGFIKQSDPELLQLSLGNEETIFAHMAKHRLQAIAHKLTKLTSNMYEDIGRQIETINDKYERELQMLERSQQTDLRQFVEEQKIKRVSDYELMIAAERSLITKDLYLFPVMAKDSIFGRIDTIEDVDGMKTYIQNVLPIDCQQLANDQLAKAQSLNAIADNCFMEALKLFHSDFEKQFNHLKILKVNLQAEVSQPDISCIRNVNMNGVTQFVAEEGMKENISSWGGAAAGAVVGNFIVPVIGGIVGGIFGYIWGFGKKNNVAQVRNQLKDKLSPALDSYFRTIVSQILSSFDEYAIAISNNIPSEIDRYLDAYKTIVDKRIAQQRNSRSKIEEKVQRLRRDQHDIFNRKHSLDSVAMRISQLTTS